ncbi:MAG: hypothetical protein V5A44_12005 [Haloarculaceae archaeon]
MDRVSVQDLPTGEYGFRLSGAGSNLETVAALVDGSEIRLYDAAAGSVVATMRKSWYAFGSVAVSDPDGDRPATVEREGVRPNLGSRPRTRTVTVPDGISVARLDNTEVVDASNANPRQKWEPTVAPEASSPPPEACSPSC